MGNKNDKSRLRIFLQKREEILTDIKANISFAEISRKYKCNIGSLISKARCGNFDLPDLIEAADNSNRSTRNRCKKEISSKIVGDEKIYVPFDEKAKVINIW